ncbi:MAG TPA: CvpA family protein [Tepidisphaeraceae bacterium]|jgi:hypothetical protein
MIFSVIVIVLIGIIAFFHYTQGFFSSAISLLLAIVSAGVAISYEEPVVNNFLGGKFADEANGMMLIVIFAVSYCILRFIFDAAIPGNVRLPVLIDKIGAGVMGLFAGIIGAGIFAIAAQMLPFGPNIAGYGRFETSEDQQVQLSSQFGQAQDMYIHDALKNDKFDPDNQKKMIIPADDWVVGFISYLSQPAGALAGDRPVSSIHPDWINELFADRLGIEPGGKHVAVNSGKIPQITVTGVYSPASLPEVGGESPDIRKDQPTGVVKSSAAQTLLVVRTLVDHNATDDDNLFRFSMATCRLITPNGKIYYGVGTVADSSTLVASRLDDFLFTEGKGADIAFLVSPSDVFTPAKQGQSPRVADGVLLQVKRLGWVNLGGKEVARSMPASGDVALLRKPDVLRAIHPPEQEVSAPLVYQDLKNSADLFTQINVGTPDADVKDQQFSSGTVSLRDHKFSKLDINSTDTIQRMRQGGYPVNTFATPTGKSVVQISAQPAGDNPWQWADALGEFTLVDTNGNKYKPNGAIAKLKEPNGQDKMAAIYDADNAVNSLAKQDGRPTDVWIIYDVPAGTQFKQWDYQDKLAHKIAE